MPLLLTLLLLLTTTLPAQTWRAEALLRGLEPSFQRGTALAAAKDGADGSVFTSEACGSLALEGKPDQVWRASHTLFSEGSVLKSRCLLATLTLLKNATGRPGKEVARTLGRAIGAAKRHPKSPERVRIGGHTVEVSWSPVTETKELLMVFVRARP